MNQYLSQIHKSNAILGNDRYDPTDALELEFIAGEISDIADEAEILSTPPKAEGRELKAAQSDLKDRLQEMHQRSRRVKCPMKRKVIQRRIAKLRQHGSLNKVYGPAHQLLWSGIVGVSSIALTAMLYQASQTRDIANRAQALPYQSLEDLDGDGVLTARPSIPYLLEKHKRFYFGELLVVGALYHHFVFGAKK